MTMHTPDDGPAPSSSRLPAASARWRVVDIVVCAIIGVAVGVVFVGWSALAPLFEAWFVVYPPLFGLIAGMWVLAAPLGGLIIRKPGAALFCEVLAAVTEAGLGSKFGPLILITGTLQGLGAELIFWLIRRRRARDQSRARIQRNAGAAQSPGAQEVSPARLLSRYTLGTTLLAGFGSGVAMSLGDIIIFYAAWTPSQQLVYAVLGWISATVLAGGLSWVIYRALLPTGALSAFASGRDAPGRSSA